MLFLTILLFAISCAAVEMIIWGRLGADSFLWNEHALLVVQRALAILLAPAALLDNAHWTDYWGLAAEVGAGMLAFSFAHNNAYNYGRLYLRWDYLLRLAFNHRGRLLIQPDSPEVIELQKRYAAYEHPSWWMVWREAARKFRWQYMSATTTARFDFTATDRAVQLVVGICVMISTFRSSALGCYVAAGGIVGLALNWYFVAQPRRRRAVAARQH